MTVFDHHEQPTLYHAACRHGARRTPGTEIAPQPEKMNSGGDEMLWLLAAVLLVLWGLGFFIAHLGDIIHFLFVLAVVVIVGTLFKGRGSRG